MFRMIVLSLIASGTLLASSAAPTQPSIPARALIASPARHATAGRVARDNVAIGICNACGSDVTNEEYCGDFDWDTNQWISGTYYTCSCDGTADNVQYACQSCGQDNAGQEYCGNFDYTTNTWIDGSYVGCSCN